MTIETQLSQLLKNWANVDQAWWVNAAEHSIKHCGGFTLIGWITVSGKDEKIQVSA